VNESTRTLPRAVDLCLAGVALILLAPVMLAIAAAIVVTSGGPVFFSQVRLGRSRESFRIHKFRTLDPNGDGDDEISPEGDPRVTPIGAWLRHSRLDELPQLYDVVCGSMALVGPRPETLANLSAVDDEQLDRWLSVRPGITGPTQLTFIAEDELLRQFSNPTQTYRSVLVPAKVAHGIDCLAGRSLVSDLAVLPQTLVVLASRRARSRSRRYVEALLRDAEVSRGVAVDTLGGSRSGTGPVPTRESCPPERAGNSSAETRRSGLWPKPPRGR
jgi:lipopolysaccharide/colanic/teichoic acid biosynthesis glycosyltransferase